MSEIIVKFDTKTKTATATIDGKEVPDLYSVSLYQGWREDDDDPVTFRLSLSALTENEEEASTTVQSVYASEKAKAEPATKVVYATEEPGDVRKSIAAFLGK